MNSQSLLKATSNRENRKENKVIMNGLDIPSSKKEEQIKSRSEAIQKLIKDKERQKEDAQRKEKEKKENKEKNSFRIPKKKPEQSVDMEKLINSLFDDSGIQCTDSQLSTSESKDKCKSDEDFSSNSKNSSTHKENYDILSSNNSQRQKSTSDKHSSSSHNNHRHKSQSEKVSSSSSSAKQSDNKSSLSSSDVRSSSTSKDYKHKSSSDLKSDLGNSKSRDSHHSGKYSSSGGINDSSTHSSTSKDYKHKSSSDLKSDLGNSKSRHSEHSGKYSSSGGTKDSLTHSSSSKGHSSSSSKSRDQSSSKPELKPSSSSKSELKSSSSSKAEVKPSSSSRSEPKPPSSSKHEPKPPSSSKHEPKPPSSSKHELKPPSSSKHDLKPTSSSKSDLKPSSSPPKNSSSPGSSVPQLTSSDQQPIILNKHHLNPTVERHASSGLSEKEMILARLQAIKQRTLEAIHKENSGKGKRFKGEKAHRKSKTEVKHDDKMKSVEIVRDIASSDDEDQVNSSVPSALDIMLSERNAKLEKEKISRMAKQAWERAMKKDTPDSDKEVKIKKKHKSSKQGGVSTHKYSKSENDDRKNNHKRKDRSVSPSHDTRKSSPKPKKKVIVRHSTQAAPPPMDFKAILEMAEKKQKEPSKPVAAIAKKKKEVDERPLTQEEKDRIERKKTKEYQDWLKFGGKPPANKDDISDEDDLPAQSFHNSVDKKQLSQNLASNDIHRVLPGSNRSSFNKHTADKDRSRPQPQTTANGDSKNRLRNITVNENVLVCGPAASSDDEGSPKRQENPFDRIMNKFHKKRPATHSSSAISHKKTRLEDPEVEEEEEYDSEMDDFIDDGDDVEPDYSKEIKKMFGYDKSKYKYEKDDDLSDMEADFSTVMMEEKRSAKLGMMEDLEDMRKEQEELKRKAMMKKRK